MRIQSLARRGAMVTLVASAALTCFVSVHAKEPDVAGAKVPLPEGLVLTTSEVPIELVGSLKTLNEQLASQVSPEENAVNLLMIVYGPNSLEPELKQFTFELLGLKQLPEQSPLFVPLDLFTKHLDGVPSEKSELRALEIQEELFNAGERIWTREEHPQLAEYLDANQAALDMVARAARQPGYYAPLVSVEQPPRILSAALNVERRLTFLVRMLCARALLHLGHGEHSKCVDDLVTCHKLAWLLAQGSPLDVSGAKAHVMDALAYRAEATCLASGKFQGEDLKRLASEFRALPPLPTADRAADIGERAIVHQEIELLSTDDDSVAGFFDHEDGGPKVKVDMSPLDWQQALASADSIWDQIVQALKTTDREQQAKLFGELDRQYDEWEKQDDADPVKFLEMLKKSPKEAGRVVGKDMAMSLRPLWWQRRATDDRARVRRDLTNLALAVALYRDDNKALPERLEDLVPKYIDSLPPDAHSGQEYLYSRLSGEQAQVMSLGPNRQNDANQTYNDDQILVVR